MNKINIIENMIHFRGTLNDLGEYISSSYKLGSRIYWKIYRLNDLP